MSDYATKKEFKQEFDEFGLKLFKYFDKRFDAIDNRFEKQDEKMDVIYRAIDAYAKQVETYQQESVARDSEVNRLRSWIEQVAHKTGVKLEY